MINGSEYAFEDIKVSVLGRSLVGFTDIRYGATKEYKNVHGRGNKPVARTRGKSDAKPGKLVVLQSEFEAMQKSAPAGSNPCDWAPFDITVSFAPIGGVVTTDIIPMCQVTDWEKGMSTEDGNMTIEFALVTDIPLLNV